MWSSVAVSLSGVGVRRPDRLPAHARRGDPSRHRPGAGRRARSPAWRCSGSSDYSHYILSAQSDPMIVALCLGAIDCHLSRRARGCAFVLGAARVARPARGVAVPRRSTSSGRGGRSRDAPADRRRGRRCSRRCGSGSRRSPRAARSWPGRNALGSGRALHNDKVFGTIRRFLDLHARPLELAALLSLALAAWRRDRTAAGPRRPAVVVWVVVEIAFALHGWPGSRGTCSRPPG